MALAADEERVLSRIEEDLCRSDPKLAAMLSMFNRLTGSEAMPPRELLATPSRMRRLSTRAGVWAARWRLYPPLPPNSRRLVTTHRPGDDIMRPRPRSRTPRAARRAPGTRLSNLSPRPSRLPSASAPPGSARHRWPSRVAAILPVIVAVLALGVMVAIFSALSRVGSPTGIPAPVGSCHSVMLAGCQSAAHTTPKP
jgi:hypothetical protein